VISHRLQTIRAADTILVMEGGELSDAGRHAELLERNAIYRLLWSQQMQRPS
jgi:ATP-binding cassette subfamily B protein